MSDALYRKYRPQTFSHLVGQEHVRITLMNALKDEHVVHAYLFCGPRGTGKTSTARLLAKAINCVHPKEDFEPCDECDLCKDISDGRLIDLIEIDAASNRGIDEIRELRDKLHFAPTRAKNKIYIIDEVHMLTKEAFNALLKMLEEPPSQVYFILATTEPHKVPDTIISRCQRFDFKRIDTKTLMTRLSYIAQLEKIEAEDSAIEAIAKNSDGGLRDAIGLFEQLICDNKLLYEHAQEMLGLSGSESINQFLEFLLGKDLQGALTFIQDLHHEGHDLGQFTKALIDALREKMLSSVHQKQIAEAGFYMDVIGHFQKAFEGFRTATILQLPLEIATIRVLGGDEVTSVATPDEAPAEKSSKTSKISAKATAPSSPTPPKTDNAPQNEKGLKKIPQEEGAIVENKTSNDGTDVETSDGKRPELTALKQYWPRVLDFVKTPLLKQSLKDIQDWKIDGTTITFAFRTKFHMEKVLASKARDELEAAIDQVFGLRVKIQGDLKEIDLGESPATEKSSLEPDVLVSAESRSGSTEDEDPAKKTYQAGDLDALAQQAADLFGGEVVEE